MTIKQIAVFESVRKGLEKLSEQKKALVDKATGAYEALPNQHGRGIAKTGKVEACNILGVSKQTMELRVRAMFGKLEPEPKKVEKDVPAKKKSETKKASAPTKDKPESKTKPASPKAKAPAKAKKSNVDTGSDVEPKFDD